MNLVCLFRGRNVLKEGGFVTPRPDEVHSICNCRGAYVHQVPLYRIKLQSFQRIVALFQSRKVEGGESIINGSLNSKIIIINCKNSLGKFQKFSRSRMTKRTAPLSSSREI